MEKEIHFAVQPGNIMFRGQLVYRVHEWSLDFEPHQVRDVSVLIGYLELEFASYFDVTRASQISGYHPHTAWKRKELLVSEAFSGSLLLLGSDEDDDILELKGRWEWETFYDQKTGWLCIGYDAPHKDDVAVEFATGLIAVVNQGYLKALWGRPVLSVPI